MTNKMKRSALRELAAEAAATDALGEVIVLGKFKDSLTERVRDGKRAMANVPREVADALQDEIGGRALYEAAFELGKRLPEGTAWDKETTTDAIRAHAALQKRRSDPEFRGRVLAGDLSAQDELAVLHERAFPPLPDGDRRSQG